MMRMLAIFVCCIALVAAEVTVLSTVQSIYNRSPKLRIKGTGFDADEHSIFLDMSANGVDSLKLDKDYMITKDDDGLILKLLTNRKWVDFGDRVPPVALVLRGVRLGSANADNVLQAPVIVANCYPTPTIAESDQIIYQTASNELRINGTGFIGAKKVDLYFSPPLYKGIYYEMVSPFPLKSNQVVLRIRDQYKWRDEPGPLMVMGVDTGGGPVKTNGEDGVIVAEVQADLDLHGVTVDDTSSVQVIYHDQANIYINGEGFNPAGNKIRFANGIMGRGVNFTTVSQTDTRLNLRIVPGSYWRKNVESLPGYLTVLAVDAGEGFVAVGATNAKKGRNVATVFEKPNVYSSQTKLFRTHSHELHISGEGFPRTLTKPQLRFDPTLVEGIDYTVSVMDRSELVVALKDGKAWRDGPGPLIVTAINTRGDIDGWVDLPGDGVHVAEVVTDTDVEVTGGVEIVPSSFKVYQSAMQDTITISGSGFKNKQMSITFEPAIKEGVDYTMDVVSKNTIVLHLKDGKKWSPVPGSLVAKSVTMDYKTFPLAGGEGIRVAVVLADPVVEEGKESFHETQSKVIAIFGHGFTNFVDLKVTLTPTEANAYKVIAVLEDTIRLQLKEGYDWLPSFMSIGDKEDSSIDLMIVDMDTGAGKVKFPSPILIGKIIKDREGVVCDDSCEYAFDGVCDDGSESEYAEYYAENGFFQDDDMGGYYSEDTAKGDAYYGENAQDDDYYMENESYEVSACVEGTDCTDCGGVDAIVDYNAVPEPGSNIEVCSNTCPYARDGVCDDPRGANYCKIGTDCQDCGPVGAANFTKPDDDGWWDDDDDYWTFNDVDFMNQNNPKLNWDKVKKAQRVEAVGPAAMFLVVLEGMVYTVGSVFAACALYLAYRWSQGYSLPFLNVFNGEMGSSNPERDLELAPTRRMPITPDVIRT